LEKYAERIKDLKFRTLEITFTVNKNGAVAITNISGINKRNNDVIKDAFLSTDNWQGAIWFYSGRCKTNLTSNYRFVINKE
jgi:hypothetical protein